MESTNVQRRVTARNLGNTQVVEEQTTAVPTVDSQDFSLAKANQVVWLLAHFIAALLGLRFIFLLLGARLVGVVLFIYNLSGLFIQPFRGIFPSPQAAGAYFDTAAIVAIIIYYLLATLLTRILILLSRNTEA